MFDVDETLPQAKPRNPDFLTQEEEVALLGAWKQGDAAAGERFVLAFRPFINKQTKQWADYYCSVERENIAGAVRLGFVKAMKKFDPAESVRFSTFAVHWVKAAAQEEGRAFTVNRAAAKTQQARVVMACVNKERGNASDEHLHEIYDRVAKAQKMSPERVRQIHESAITMVSGDSTGNKSSGEELSSLFDRIEDTAVQAAEIAEKKNILMVMRNTIHVLPPREKYVIAARFGLFSGHEEEERTLQQIGDVLQLSKERVRQIEARALQMLRHEFHDMGFDLDKLMSPPGKNGHVCPRRYKKSAPALEMPAL